MVQVGTVLKYAGLFILAVLIICVIFEIVTIFGQKTLVSETIQLSPGASKTYSLPPGFVNINVKSDVAISEADKTLVGNYDQNAANIGMEGFGNPLVTECELTNSGNSTATVDVTITTGALNPFS